MRDPISAPPGPERPPTEAEEPAKADPAHVPESLRRRRLTRPGVGVILGQLRRDFIGKDVQQTTTYSYVWSADQSGHFMLGFAPTFAVYWACAAAHDWLGVTWYTGPYGPVYAACGVMAVWLGLELYDLYDSVSKIRRSSGYFAANTANLVWNVATALGYFGVGAAVAGASAFGPGWALAAAAGLFVAQAPVAAWWLRSKIVFQQAGLPYLYRLPNYDGRFDSGGAAGGPDSGAGGGAVAFIGRLIGPPADPAGTTDVAGAGGRRHLIVSGPQNSGKTSLGVGIGTEFAFSGGIGRYITMSGLAQIAGGRAAGGLAAEAGAAPPPARGSLPSGRGRSPVPEEHEFNDGRILWKWASVDLLVIDDVVELLLPARRAIEGRLTGDGFRREVEAELFGSHPRLVELLGGEARARQVLDETLGEVQARLRVLAGPEVVAKYVAESFAEVLGVIGRIPRVVWVLGDMIRPDLFEGFVRREFGFTGGRSGDLLSLRLLPPPASDGRG